MNDSVSGSLATGLHHQPTQRQVDEQQGVEFLLGQVGAARAEHELPAGQRDLQFGEGAFLFPALMVQRGQFRGRCAFRIEPGSDQAVQRLGVGDTVQAILDDPHDDRALPSVRAERGPQAAQERPVGQAPVARELLIGPHAPQQVGARAACHNSKPTKPARHSMPGRSRSSSGGASATSLVS
jgi:hypothetical protein